MEKGEHTCDHISFGRLRFEEFSYSLLDDILNHEVLNQLFGQVECVPQLPGITNSHIVCDIRDGRLVVTGLHFCVSVDDSYRIKERVQPSKESMIVGHPSPKNIELIELSYDLCCPINFSGTLSLKQHYVDEVRYANALTHDEVSNFVFDDGVLDVDASRIYKSKQTVLAGMGRIWNENLPRELTPTSSCRRVYFVNPQGNMRQNDYLIDLLCAYQSYGVVNESALEWVLSHDEPVFRTHLKAKTAPGSLIFEDQIYDLIAEARKNDDTLLLERLLKKE